MEETCDGDAEPEFVLAVVAPVRRRRPWPEAPPTPPASRPGVPARPEPVAVEAPRVADAAAHGPTIMAAAGERPDGWPDRRWWTSTAVSTVVHVVVLTILALMVTVPEQLRRVRPLEIAQPAPEADDGVDFLDAEQLAVVEIEVPEPVVDAAADEPVLVEVDVAAEADAAAFEVPDVAVDIVDVDPDGLVARIGGWAGRPAGGGAEGGPVAGFGGDVGRRLAAAGAQTGDVQVSLSWDNFNDIDLHVIAPSGERIFFGHRASLCRGILDVDMNATGPQSREPVENVFWPAKRAPPGEYRVFVHHYWRFDPRHDETTFTIHVLVDGRKQRFTGSVKSGDPPVAVAEFRKGVDAEAVPGGAAGGESGDGFVE